MNNLTSLILSLTIATNIFAGDGKPFKTVDSTYHEFLNWYNLDIKTDKMVGMSVEKAYNELLKDKEAKKTIIVAVVDGGVDTKHEDLVGKIWINEDEIPNNGIDDDKNGYIDDIHGWNFLGNANGENANETNLELTRVYRLYNKYHDVKPEDVPDTEKKAYDLYTQVKPIYEADTAKYFGRRKKIEGKLVTFQKNQKTIAKFLKKEEYVIADVKEITSEDSTIIKAKTYMIDKLEKGINEESYTGTIDYYKTYTDYYLNLDYNIRKSIIKDNPSDFSDAYYGNNNVKGPDAFHGTFVSGVIAAVRNNSIGVNGVAENVKIMALRAVPNGDEHDKDIALSIRYAVDNGANIINMSFGKYYSPYKEDLDKAVKYAESKGVLFVSAAGNNAKDVEKEAHFPVDSVGNSTVNNWIAVGASSKDLNKELAGDFSNYGNNTIDIFAPGVRITSLTPDNFYDNANGTSFSCPAVSGVAALVWSYYPDLTAVELKSIILESGADYGKKKVYLPSRAEKKSKVKFGTLSGSGKVANAYNALKLAEERSSN